MIKVSFRILYNANSIFKYSKSVFEVVYKFVHVCTIYFFTQMKSKCQIFNLRMFSSILKELQNCSFTTSVYLDTPYRGVERKNNSLWAISPHLPSMAVHLLWFSHWYSLMISLSTETTGCAAIWVKTQIPPHIRWLQWTEVCVSKLQQKISSVRL